MHELESLSFWTWRERLKSNLVILACAFNTFNIPKIISKEKISNAEARITTFLDVAIESIWHLKD